MGKGKGAGRARRKELTATQAAFLARFEGVPVRTPVQLREKEARAYASRLERSLGVVGVVRGRFVRRRGGRLPDWAYLTERGAAALAGQEGWEEMACVPVEVCQSCGQPATRFQSEGAPWPMCTWCFSENEDRKRAAEKARLERLAKQGVYPCPKCGANYPPHMTGPCYGCGYVHEKVVVAEGQGGGFLRTARRA